MVYTVYVKEYSSDAIYEMLDNVIKYSKTECQQIYSRDGTVETTFFDPADYACGQVPANSNGSYLTMKSGGGLIFGIINIIGNFGTVFVDQSYWQSGIAAKPEAAYKGYMLGGLVWFTIPFALATSLGLAGVALELPISAAEAGSGLVPPAVATHLFGSAGGIMIAIMLFMAIVSTGSAESIAVSSIITYDIYGTYFNKECTSDDILKISRIVIVVFGVLVMGPLSCLLWTMGIGLGWVYLFMGIMIGSAVAPLALMMTWDRLPGWGAMAAAWTGMALAFLVWIISAVAMEGSLTIATLGGNFPMLYGNLTAIFSSALICFITGKMNKDVYDWKSMKAIALIKEKTTDGVEEDVKLAPDMKEMTDEYLDAAMKKIWNASIITSIILIVVWPLLSVPAGVFSKGYFAFWVFISLVWGLTATTVIIVLPLYESWNAINTVIYGLMGKEMPKAAEESAAPAEVSLELAVKD